MFGNWFKRKLDSDVFTNLVAHGTRIAGTVEFTGVIKVEGNIEGDVIQGVEVENGKVTKDCIILTHAGKITSERIKSFDMILGGEVNTKTIWVEDTLRILSSAKISNATIYHRNLEIEPGASIHNCVMKNLDLCSEGEII